MADHLTRNLNYNFLIRNLKAKQYVPILSFVKPSRSVCLLIPEINRAEWNITFFKLTCLRIVRPVIIITNPGIDLFFAEY